jgi:hypothetical protein
VALFDLIRGSTPFTGSELSALINTAPRRYKVYQIPKRDGKTFRTIAQPAPEVKLLQSVMMAEVISKWPVHEAATAYRQGISIREHAVRHASSRYLLKMDFSNFFPSISAEHIRAHATLHSHLIGRDLDILTNILCWRNKASGAFGLSIGAPSSPMASNSILFEFDALMTDFCNEQKISYSRYADDLAFSSNEPNKLAEAQLKVASIIQRIAYPRLSINGKKTVNISTKHRRVLLGLVLTPDNKVSLGRELKRSLHAKVHHFSLGTLATEDLPELRGLLSYAWSIERDFIFTLAKKYGNKAFEDIGLPFRY